MSRRSLGCLVAGVALWLPAPWLFAGGELAAACLSAGWLLAGLGFGAIALQTVHALTGGPWGEALRGPLRTVSVALLPASALLPVSGLWLPALYPWVEAPGAQAWYLNPAFFRVRLLLILASWCLLALWLPARRAGPQQGRRGSVLALLWLGLSGSVAGIDWAMSLTPEFHSAGFGLLSIAGWSLGAMALAVLLGARPALPERLRADLGAWLLMLTLLWAYLMYMDYLTAWVGDQPSALSWYWPRLRTGWTLWVGIGLLLRVVLPLLLLLDGRLRRSTTGLRWVAASLLTAQLLEAMLMILPSLRPDGVQLSGADPLVLLGAVLVAIGAGLGLRDREARRA